MFHVLYLSKMGNFFISIGTGNPGFLLLQGISISIDTRNPCSPQFSDTVSTEDTQDKRRFIRNLGKKR